MTSRIVCEKCGAESYADGASLVCHTCAAQLEGELATAKTRIEQTEIHNANLLREVSNWRLHVDHVESDRDEIRQQYQALMNRTLVTERDLATARAAIGRYQDERVKLLGRLEELVAEMRANP